MKYKLKKSSGSSLNGDLSPYKDLDAQQLQAVKSASGPLLIIAGAGTGKTKTLITRTAHLLLTGVDPRKIMVCTFTQKAARELIVRLNSLIGPLATEIWAGTFHHLGNRILRTHGKSLGLGNDFSILDYEDSTDLLKSILTEKKTRSPLTAKKLLSLFSYAIGTQKPLYKLIKDDHKDLLKRVEEILDIFSTYTEKKMKQQVVDFDDLLALWKIALKNRDENSEVIKNLFDHILVDEFQDTNKLQNDILYLMVEDHKNITVVGDDAQSIYSFRGAEPQNIKQFLSHFKEATTVKLETNYRSTQEILDIANISIAKSSEIIPKKLVAFRGKGIKPVVVKVQDSRQEAQFVTQRLWELHNEDGLNLGEIAILFRTNKQGLEIELELSRAQIPFSVNGGKRITEQAHFKDFIAYIRIFLNPADEIALLRLFGFLPGVGHGTARKLYPVLEKILEEENYVHGEHPLYNPAILNMFSGSIGKKVAQLSEFFQSLEKVRKDVPKLMERILFNYIPILNRKFTNANDRLEELKEFVSLGYQYETPDKLLSDLGLQAGPIAVKFAEKPQPEDSVVISTIHQAKGLEWKALFILSLSEGSFPLIFKQTTDTNQFEEERRIFHVGVTRAKDYLYMMQPMLTGASDKQRVIRRPSRYLTELPFSMFETWEIELEDDQ